MEHLGFAQEAIHFGVKDYLLKPLVPEEVEQLSRELQEKIETRDRNANTHEMLLRQVQESKPVLKERLFWDLVGQQLDADALREKLEFLGIAFPADSFQVILLESEDGGRGGSRKKTLSLMRALENHILDFFSAQERVTVFHLSTRMFAILSNRNATEVESCDMEGQLERLAHGISHDLGLAITVSLGTLVTGTGNIGASYYHALSTLTYKALLGQGAILKSSDFLDDGENQKLAFTLEEVTFLVKTGQTQKLRDHIANTFDLISGASHRFDLTTIYLTCYKYICAILNAPVEYGIRVDELYRDRPNPLHDGGRRRTLEELRAWILEVAMEVVEYVSEFRRNRNSDDRREGQGLHRPALRAGCLECARRARARNEPQ